MSFFASISKKRKHPVIPQNNPQIFVLKLAGLTLIFVMALLLLLPSCRPAAAQQATQYQVELFVRYLEPEQAYKAEASVQSTKPGGTPQPSRFPSGITFGSQPLRPLRIGSGAERFLFSSNGAYQPNAAFNFVDEGGKKISIPVRLSPIQELRVNSPIAATGLLSFTAVASNRLQTGETLVALLTDARGQSFSLELAGPAVSDLFDVPLSAFGRVAPGRATLYVVKKLAQTTTPQAQWQVRLQAEYYSAVVELDIQP